MTDADSDNDGLPNWFEILYSYAGELDPTVSDSKGNGISDADEYLDYDILTNIEELLGANGIESKLGINILAKNKWTAYRVILASTAPDIYLNNTYYFNDTQEKWNGFETGILVLRHAEIWIPENDFPETEPVDDNGDLKTSLTYYLAGVYVDDLDKVTLV